MSLPTFLYYCTACEFEQGNTGAWGTREYVLGDGVHAHPTAFAHGMVRILPRFSRHREPIQSNPFSGLLNAAVLSDVSLGYILHLHEFCRVPPTKQ